ncbi:hypothetical protein N9L68_01845 [bacterium]|nr:hypothetical protein [bacterium]
MLQQDQDHLQEAVQDYEELEALDEAVLVMMQRQTAEYPSTPIVTEEAIEPKGNKALWSNIQGRTHGGNLFAVGILTAAAYGSELHGASPARVEALRLAQRSAMHSKRIGVRGAVVRAIVRPRDPAFMQLAPLLRYHREWWLSVILHDEDALTPATLVEAYDGARESFDCSSRSWKAAAANPVQLAIWAAKALQWEFINATTLRTQG